MWEMCGGFEGIISCNNGKVVESDWENSGFVIMTFMYIRECSLFMKGEEVIHNLVL